MNQNIKKIIAILAMIAILAIGYYGSYLPLRKSKIYIKAISSVRGSISVAEFIERLSVPLDVPSPIGQEELVRQIGSASISVLQKSRDQPAVIKQIVDFVEGYYEPLVQRSGGMSFNQDLHILGSVNEIAFISTGELQYLKSAKKYFLMAQERGPSRPQPLLGLFDVYRIENNVEKVKEVTNQILEYWPDSEQIREQLTRFLEESGAVQK